MLIIKRKNNLLNRYNNMELNRLWIIGKKNYIRFYPNPGFRFVYKDKEFRWNKFYGLRWNKKVK